MTAACCLALHQMLLVRSLPVLTAMRGMCSKFCMAVIDILQTWFAPWTATIMTPCAPRCHFYVVDKPTWQILSSVEDIRSTMDADLESAKGTAAVVQHYCLLGATIAADPSSAQSSH